MRKISIHNVFRKGLALLAALVMCLSGAALAEDQGGELLDSPEFGFTLPFYSIKSTDPSVQAPVTKFSFETADLDGNPISSEELFGSHEYTLLNIWASWCVPCAEELDELDALDKRLAHVDCAVVGLLQDSAEQSKVDKAKALMAEKGAEYLCVKAPEGFGDILLVQSFPTAYVVDRTGAVVSEAIVGAEPSVYEETIMELLTKGPDETRKDGPKDEKPTYTVRLVDQNGDPVPEAAVAFCLDTGCVPVETDENGVAVYSGASGRYHVRVVDAPDEYDYPDDTDTYLGPESGEITLVITKE